MLPSTRPASSRSSRPTLRLILVALVVGASAVLVALVAGRSGAGGAAGPGESARQPSSPARSGGSAFDPTRVAVTLEPFVDGLSAPLGIANAGDGSGRLFVAEQGGRIRVVRDGRILATPFLDISDRITSGGERGLLGVAFHPKFPDDPRVFVDYTDANGDTQVSSFRVAAPGDDTVDPASEIAILHVSQPFANHNGGALAFDPDGMLLIALGDGGSGGDPQGNGQSLGTLLGKILRIDIEKNDADHPYRIPANNPFRDGANGNRPEIWLWGLRNPWRMSFDRATGDLWIGDVGQNSWEEIDVHRGATPGGTNYGWNRMEGSHCFQPPQGCEDPALTGPVTDYGRDSGCTVIGGNVYRGATQTALAGGYVFGDYCSGRIWAIDPAIDGYRAPVEIGQSGRSLVAFGEDEAGELYAADIGKGAVLRVTATAR
jgi:glucose/arabinose dehydrogenase